jgi:RNA polymerase sigma-70 factor (sigma-E family)
MGGLGIIGGRTALQEGKGTMRVGEQTEQTGSTRERPADAFGNAIRDHGDRLARIAFFLCGNRSQAEDLVADAFAAAWPKWSAGRIDELGPYLRRIVVNQASKDRRHWRVVMRHENRFPPLKQEVPGADEDLGTRIDLAQALAALPRQQRVPLVLRYLEDMSEQEIATLLRIAPGTVKSRLSRALDALRSQLAEVGDDA